MLLYFNSHAEELIQMSLFLHKSNFFLSTFKFLIEIKAFSAVHVV